MNNKIIFGTDGVRAKVGVHPMTAEAFVKLGYAVGKMLGEQFTNPSVIIGKDTRLSGYIFESAIQAGLLSSGVNVGLLGPMPTPAVAYLTRAYDASAGVVISASHNAWSDNGIKFFKNNGTKFHNNEQQRIMAILEKGAMKIDNKKIGKAIRRTQALGRYIEFCKSSFNRTLSLNKLTIVIDSANGATYHIAAPVFKELGAKVIMINHRPNGTNINQNCGSTNTTALSAQVLNNKANLGIAFDGDGDRVIFVDEDGNTIHGDELMFLIAKYYKEQNILKNKVVVSTQMTNMGIQQEFNKLNINFIATDVGDRFIAEAMQTTGAILGGERSGHIICANHTTTGDGIIAALQILELIQYYHKSIKQIVSGINKYPQQLINIKTPQKFNINELTRINDKFNKEFANKGRVFIRKSGTENLLRVMIEHRDNTIVNKTANTIRRIIAV